jgi:hypothetical protein
MDRGRVLGGAGSGGGGSSGVASRRGAEDGHTEFRVGRLKHERVRVPRDEHLLAWAMQVMRQHASRKTILEVRFT